jgi:hypothetical protein
MTYEESATLMNDPAFRNRVKVACMKFAAYIMDEESNVPAHQTRIKWAQRTIANPDAVTAEVSPPTVMDGQVQGDGSSITDEALQTSVETTVNKML